MIRKASRIIAIVAGCLVLLTLYMLSSSSSSETRVEYTVDARDPANGILHVTMVLHPPVRPFVTLWLRDTRQGGLQRVEHFSASRDGKLLPNWQSIPGLGDARNVWTGFSRDPIEIRYDVNPRWVKGQAPRSYLGPDFGYLRGMVVLYTPITAKSISGMLNNVDVLEDSAGEARLRLLLPDGWTLISPWKSSDSDMPIAYLRNIYFGVGPMSVATAQVGDSVLLLGVYRGLEEEQRDRLLQDIPQLFETIGKLTGISPISTTHYRALTILPNDPIHGGASGVNSLVTSDDLDTISHEMFHWWNGDAVRTMPDANWIREGFTEYYEGKVLYSAGIWSSDEFDEHLAKLYEQNAVGLTRIDGQWTPVNLIQASENLARRQAEEEYYKVYNGGALVAYFLDQKLQAQGKSLDEIWRLLHEADEIITTDIFLQKLALLGGAELARQCEDWVYGRAALTHP